MGNECVHCILGTAALAAAISSWCDKLRLRMTGEEPGERHFELLSGANSASSATLFPAIPTIWHQISIASIQWMPTMCQVLMMPWWVVHLRICPSSYLLARIFQEVAASVLGYSAWGSVQCSYMLTSIGEGLVFRDCSFIVKRCVFVLLTSYRLGVRVTISGFPAQACHKAVWIAQVTRTFWVCIFSSVD